MLIMGNRTQAVEYVLLPEEAGTYEVTIDYGYDPLYRLTAADYSDDTYYHYTYDAVGNRLTQETDLVTNAYTYDIANRLASVDSVTYTWDDAGSLLSDGAKTYAYDSAHRLVSVSDWKTSVTFAYNGLGDRYQQTAGEEQTTYALDINTGLTQVLDDGANSYLHGV
jgi:hypothetical protein